MSNPEMIGQTEQEPNQHWKDIFGILSQTAKDRLSDHGRAHSQKNISRQVKFYESGLKVRVESTDVDNWFTVVLKSSRDNSEASDVRPPKGINLQWATGKEDSYLMATFTVSRHGVSAYGLPLTGNEEVKLELLNTANASRHFEDLAKIAIDSGKLPHLFS